MIKLSKKYFRIGNKQMKFSFYHIVISENDKSVTSNKSEDTQTK